MDINKPEILVGALSKIFEYRRIIYSIEKISYHPNKPYISFNLKYYGLKKSEKKHNQSVNEYNYIDEILRTLLEKNHSEVKRERRLTDEEYLKKATEQELISELTLYDEEIYSLFDILSNNCKNPTLIDDIHDRRVTHGKKEDALDSIDDTTFKHLKEYFRKYNNDDILKILIDNDILTEDIVSGLEHNKKVKAIKYFEELLKKQENENIWQDWFKKNDWIFCSDFVQIIDERRIDIDKIVDFLGRAYDGFLDLIEIKPPNINYKFWVKDDAHNNYVPSSDLIRAIVQAHNYLLELEKKMDSDKIKKRFNNINIIKPRGILIYGRSNDWDEEKMISFRLLNSWFHNLTILTYDQVLNRAKRMLNLI